MYKVMILLNTFSSNIRWPVSTKFHVAPTVETGFKVCSNGYAPLTYMLIYSKMMIIKKTHSSFSKPRTAQMMILSILAMTGLEKCCIASAYLQWLFHSGERAVARGPLVISSVFTFIPVPLSSLFLSFVSSTISSVSFLPFHGRLHKMTYKG